jgi:hypothetical protein
MASRTWLTSAVPPAIATSWSPAAARARSSASAHDEGASRVHLRQLGGVGVGLVERPAVQAVGASPKGASTRWLGPATKPSTETVRLQVTLVIVVRSSPRRAAP